MVVAYTSKYDKNNLRIILRYLGQKTLYTGEFV